MVVEDEGEHDAGTQQILDAERVNGGIVCWPVVHSVSLVQGTNERDSPETIAHNVKDIATASNEEQLHDEVVQ